MNMQTRIKSLPKQKTSTQPTTLIPIYELLFTESVQNGMYNSCTSQARLQFLPVNKAQRMHSCCWFHWTHLCFTLLFSKQFGWKLKFLPMFWCTLFLKVEAFSSPVWNYSWLSLVPMGSHGGISTCTAGYVHGSAPWISESSAVHPLFGLRKGPLDFCSLINSH